MSTTMMAAALPTRKLMLFGSGATAPRKREHLILPSPVSSPEELALDAILSNRTKRNKLLSIYASAFETRHISNKLRCIMAIDEFDKIVEKTDKKQRGRKIVASFVQIGSLYHVQDVPKPVHEALLLDDKTFFYFYDLRAHCKQTLALDLDVQREVANLLQHV